MLRHRSSLLVVLPLIAVLLLGAAGLEEQYRRHHSLRLRAETLTGGNVKRGSRLFVAYGCGGCHSLGGVPGARGLVGPRLDGVGAQAVIAGRLSNNPNNMMRWIGDPQGVSPGTAMPNLDVTPAQQRDIAALLYSRS